MPTDVHRQAQRRLRMSLALLAPLALLACTASKESKVAMEHACQTKACVCSEADAPLLSAADTVPLKWRDNGDAYCPEDFTLRFDD